MRVLIIEDSDVTRRVLGEYLTLAGHEVESAADGWDAVALARRFSPQVVVSDWRLGAGPDGIEVARALCARDRAPRLVFVTGHDRHQLERATAGLPVVTVLQKPVPLSTLRDVVEAVETDS